LTWESAPKDKRIMSSIHSNRTPNHSIPKIKIGLSYLTWFPTRYSPLPGTTPRETQNLV
jgi:hypothetical protein